MASPPSPGDAAGPTPCSIGAQGEALEVPLADAAHARAANVPVLLCRTSGTSPEVDSKKPLEQCEADLEAANSVQSPGVPINFSAGAFRAEQRQRSATSTLAKAAGLLRLSGSSLDTETRTAITFRDPTLLRGISAAKVLQAGGSVLSSSSGSEATFAMSRVVQKIDVFISHNWSTPRAKKFRVLALCFNQVPALMFNLALGLVFMTMQAFGLLPTLDMISDNGREYKLAPYNMLIGTAFFFLSLFHWHELRSYLPISGPTAFLDKTCIDQVDEDRKRKGIECLAAFVRHSNSMVVVYSDSYLQKLWTVYELACFMTLKPTDRLIVVPVVLADVMVAGINLFLAISILDAISDMAAVHKALDSAGLQASGYVVTALLVVPCTLLFCRMWRQWLLEQSRIQEQAANFSVFKAHCMHESDRPLIKRSIARFMKGIGLVPKTAPEEAALEAFDHKVTLEVPRALKVSVGRAGILYRHACVIFLPLALGIMDSIGVALQERDHDEPGGTRRLILRVLGGCTTYMAFYPTLLVALSAMMGASLRLKKQAFIWTSYTVTALVIVAIAIYWGILEAQIRNWAVDTGVGLAVYLALCTASFALVAFFYR